jgi:HAE1 family hydrophobic/amphiphilic exporter-1
MGTTVIGGMLAASALGIFFVPAVFCLVEKFSPAESKKLSPATAMPLPAQNREAGDD